MNTIEGLCRESGTIAAFAAAYFGYLKRVLDDIPGEAVEQVAEEFREARRDGTVIFVAGNGGSATTATSMSNDLGFDVMRKTGTDRPFRVVALTDNMAAMTAIANDVGYEDVFVNQLRVHFRQGDRLMVISASGNSPNLVRAAEWVKAHGGRVIGLVGFQGGTLKDLCDVVVHVPSEAGEYGPVEDAHLALNHVLAHWFQHELRT